MLTLEQLKHFAQHGWVIKERVFDDEFMDECRQAMDETAIIPHVGRGGLSDQADDSKASDEQTFMMGIVKHHQIFRNCLLNPILLEDSRQLMGTDLRHRATWMIIKEPHPKRHQNRSGLIDPINLPWHRDMRPKWGTFADDHDPELINCILTNCMVTVTDIGPDDGGTMALDGSHKVDGDPTSVMQQCPVVQLEAPRGSVIYFPETLMHSAVPILGETTRYVMFYAFVPPWFEVWQHCDVPQEIVDTYEDESLRSIIGGYGDIWGYPGQYPVAGDNGS